MAHTDDRVRGKWHIRRQSTGQVAHTGDRVRGKWHIRAGRQSRSTYISVGKPVGRGQLGRGRCRMEYNSKMNDGGVDWVNLLQDRDKWWAVLNFFVVYKIREHCSLVEEVLALQD